MNKAWKSKYDAIVVLGGGRIDEETLTDLSKQRLDKEAELLHEGVAPRIFVLGLIEALFPPRFIRQFIFPRKEQNYAKSIC